MRAYLPSLFLFVFYFFTANQVVASPKTIDNHIKIDQFGYLCTAQKIAVISNPQTGYNSNAPFLPGAGANNYQVRRWSDDAVVYSGTIVAWNGGTTHSQSGDKVWWFDFSTYSTSGTYYIYDVANGVGSYAFDIQPNVYANVLKTAVRMFYYQRCGIAKTTTNAGAEWADAICHNHPTNQDANCMLYSSPSNTATSKVLSGGWHDAGDYNKYVNFAWEELSNLLFAYSESPSIWTDDYNIPESGNGIPDILDESKWELDWLLKMQQSDGSVLSMVGNPCSTSSNSPPPSGDINQRVYGPATTSATFSAACLYSLAAIQFKSLGIPSMTTYANTLQSAAQMAWTWASSNPSVTWSNNTGTCYIVSGEQEVADYDRLCRQLSAAAFLYKLTGNTTYKTYFESNYTQTHLLQWGYAYLFEPVIQDALLYYASLPGVTSTVANAITTAYSNSMKTGNTDNLPSFLNQTDAYRAYMSDNNYTWGSNSSKGVQGNMMLAMNTYGLDAANATNYHNAASGFVHYLHGVNPNALVYLTNMSSFGAENSLTSIFHSWFADGSSLWDQVGVSKYGPAPGYLSGGPNPSYALDGCCPSGCGGNNSLCSANSVTPPLNQPAQKSYKDWNSNWPQDSWSVTEPSLGYQAKYVRMLSKFMGNGGCSGTTTSISDVQGNYQNPVWQIYPNPLSEQLFLVAPNPDATQDCKVEIFDSVGGLQFITNTQFTTSTIIINTSAFKRGLYVVQISNRTGRYSQKIEKE
jgi:hypothetical protein